MRLRCNIDMKRCVWMLLAGFIVAATISLGAEAGEGMENSGRWSGIIINKGCTADEAFAEAEKCTANVPGSKYVLYDDTTRQIFDLDPQAPAAGHLGDAVTVQGILGANTIRVSSLHLLT